MTDTSTVQASGLSIGDLAARTGVSAMTLRSWETRHGLLHPERSRGGHRRYREADVQLVEAVVRHRGAGLGLTAAITAARATAPATARSLFADLREQHPHLPVNVLPKPAMLAVSRAIEDESCARAERPILFGFFQEERFFGASEPRWTELSRTARAAFVFADFVDDDPSGHDGPERIDLAADSLVRREWALVCDAVDHPACLVGWERPAADGTPRGPRRFESIWSVEPAVVRTASRFALDLVRAARPGSAETLREHLDGAVPRASEDLRRAGRLLDRTIGYLAALTDPTGTRGSAS